MKRVVLMLVLAAALGSTCAFAQTDTEPEKDPLKERIGLRAGYAWTPNGLSDAFGGAVNLSLHFIQRIKKPLAVDVTLGAIYLGSTDTEVDIADANGNIYFTTRWFDNVSMRIITVTAAPMIELTRGDRWSYYFAAGPGLYATTLILDQGFEEWSDFTDYYFGLTGGAGVMRRLSTNWFADLNLHLHQFFTPDDPEDVNWIYEFSGGDSDPLFWSITAGVSLRLF